MLRLRAYSFAFWLLVSQVGGLETSDDTLIKTVLPISAGSPGNRLPVVDSISYYRNQLIMTHKPGVSAHRGSSGDAPENTLATFRAALAMQVDYIEIDVRTTKDGRLVILHDATLNRTTNGSGPVRDQTLAQLKKLSAAKGVGDSFQTEKIPTLDEVCQLLTDWNTRNRSKIKLYVDCKDVAPEPLTDVLTNYGLLNEAVFYGADDYLADLQKIAPTTKLMPALKKVEDISRKVNRLHPYAFDVSWPFLDKSLVNQIHQQGIRVFTDLLDEADSPEQYRKAAQLGVDVIQTDHVMRVYQTLATETNK